MFGILASSFKNCDMIYYIGGPTLWWMNLILFVTRKPIVSHWIGSDVLSFRNGKATAGWRGYINRRATYKWFRYYVADSPELANELKDMAISASVVRLLPARIEAEPELLPHDFTVLSYWLVGKKEFYGGDIVLRLAKEMPQVKFIITGTLGAEEESLSNVRYLGFHDNVEDLYRRSSALIRLPEHDSLSAMVLEMLARGRYVIYNKRMPGCIFAQNYEEAKKSLQQILTEKEPNTEGAHYVKKEYSIMREAEKLGTICKDVMNDLS